MLYQARREQGLNQVLLAIRNSLDLDTIFSTAVEEIGNLLQVDHVKISQYLPDKKVWLTKAHYRSRPELPLSVGEGIPDEGNPVTVQLKRLEVVRIADASLCEDEVSRKIAQKFPGAWLILPLHFNKEVWGSLCILIDGRPYPWQDSEVELATAVANQLAIAIQQSQLYQQTLYQARREQGLNRVLLAIRNSLDLDTIFSTAVEEIGNLLQVDHVKISQYLPDKKVWLTKAHYRSRPELPLSVGEGIPDEGNPVTVQLKRLEVVRIADASLCEDEVSRKIAQKFPGAWLILPLHFNKEVWGSLCILIDGRPHPWQDSEVELATAVADQLAIAIQQSQLYQLLQQLAEAEIFKALQRERELSEAKSRFIAITSHEFRTPLTVIQSAVDLLKCFRDRMSQEQQEQYLEQMSSAVLKMTQMMQDVLLLSAVEAGRLQFNPTPVDIVQLCHTVIAAVQAADNNQHSIVFTVSGECRLNLLLDAKLVGYILTNLLNNATKYSPSESPIQFDIICQPDQVYFRIQDQGIGIPQKDLPYVFESFYRATNVGTLPGTGLGLVIVKQCVDLHGGQITINSVVGDGTTLTVALPLS